MKLYEPRTPHTGEDPFDYFQSELRKIAETFTSMREGIILEPTTVAPSKPQDGELRHADGVNWNPGGYGNAFYRYESSTASWIKLG